MPLRVLKKLLFCLLLHVKTRNRLIIGHSWWTGCCIQAMALYAGEDRYTGPVCSAKVLLIVVGDITNAVNKALQSGSMSIGKTQHSIKPYKGLPQPRYTTNTSICLKKVQINNMVHSGCGTVGRVVDFNTKRARFECSPRQFY